MQIQTIWGFGVLERRKPWLVNEDRVLKRFAAEALAVREKAKRMLDQSKNAERMPDQSKSSSRSPFYNHGAIE